jgi:hypothetical protein
MQFQRGLRFMASVLFRLTGWHGKYGYEPNMVELSYGAIVVQHGRKAGWRHDRDTLERVEREPILISTDDHLGTAAGCHRKKLVSAGIAAGNDAPVRPDQLAAQDNQPERGAQDAVTQPVLCA